MLKDGRNRMFFTSDWHCHHENVLKYDQRPFRDLDHMHRVLINNWNACVGPQDTGFFLGDMGLCKGNLLASIIAQLNGTKVLILGNHDKGATAMKRMGFSVVLHSASMEIAGQLVTMSHCPLRGVWREDCRAMHGYQEGDNWHKEHKHSRLFSVADHGQFHLHGHIHTNPDKPNGPSRIQGKQLDVGVAGNGYRPVSMSAIESWISTYGK